MSKWLWRHRDNSFIFPAFLCFSVYPLDGAIAQITFARAAACLSSWVCWYTEGGLKSRKVKRKQEKHYNSINSIFNVLKRMLNELINSLIHVLRLVHHYITAPLHFDIQRLITTPLKKSDYSNDQFTPLGGSAGSYFKVSTLYNWNIEVSQLIGSFPSNWFCVVQKTLSEKGQINRNKVKIILYYILYDIILCFIICSESLLIPDTQSVLAPLLIGFTPSGTVQLWCRPVSV